jgi:hypothetical protein
MAVVSNQRKMEYHPTKRREVLASADVRIQQVQVVDKMGAMRSVVVWQCGTDIMFSETMDGLFDSARRYNAPDWLVKQLKLLPPSRRFDYTGAAYGGGDGEARRPTLEVAPTLPEGLEDDDIEGAEQA